MARNFNVFTELYPGMTRREILDVVLARSILMFFCYYLVCEFC